MNLGKPLCPKKRSTAETPAGSKGAVAQSREESDWMQASHLAMYFPLHVAAVYVSTSLPLSKLYEANPNGPEYFEYTSALTRSSSLVFYVSTLFQVRENFDARNRDGIKQPALSTLLAFQALVSHYLQEDGMLPISPFRLLSLSLSFFSSFRWIISLYTYT